MSEEVKRMESDTAWDSQLADLADAAGPTDMGEVFQAADTISGTPGARVASSAGTSRASNQKSKATPKPKQDKASNDTPRDEGAKLITSGTTTPKPGGGTSSQDKQPKSRKNKNKPQQLSKFISAVSANSPDGPELGDPVRSEQIDALSETSTRLELAVDDHSQRLKELEALVEGLRLSQGRLLNDNAALTKSVQSLMAKNAALEKSSRSSLPLGKNLAVAPKVDNPPGPVVPSSTSQSASSSQPSQSNEGAPPALVASWLKRKKPVY